MNTYESEVLDPLTVEVLYYEACKKCHKHNREAFAWNETSKWLEQLLKEEYAA